MDGKLIYFLYRALQLAGAPFIVLYFLLRGLKNRRYFRAFHERLGFLPHSFRQAAPGAIWLHAVSVGEVLLASELLRRLRTRLPSAPLFVSTSTLTGRALAVEKLDGLADGVFYAPVDYCFAVRRVLRTLRPSLLAVVETEIWPNLYRETRRTGCALLLVNGRISDRAIPRYELSSSFFGAVLRLPDLILTQTEVSRRRFLSLGAPEDRVRLGGNLKHDLESRQTAIPEAVCRFVDSLAPREVWIAASTMPPLAAADPDEDDVVIDAFRQLAPDHPGMLLILVPRRPERFDPAARKLAEAAIPFVRRSDLPPEGALPSVLLLDSIGELSGLFALTDAVFMGGTLASRGGHNILEPAFFAKPVVIGPHMENFPDIAEEFRNAQACLDIRNASELAPAIHELLAAPELRENMGSRARRLAESKRGATERAVGEMVRLYTRALPHYRPVFPLYPLLWMLSHAWKFGSTRKRRRGLARRERLATPVISVGGVTVGGSGKTPFVLWLAARLREAGHAPALLTRGYRRRAPEKHTVLEPGAGAPPSRTGDEAQIFLRSALGPVGIGADRAATGRLVEQRFHPSVFLLDDGFQHSRLERDLDIVLLDALSPFGGGHTAPLGRLREPLDALSRADMFVLTRSEPGYAYEGIRATLEDCNPQAPVFYSRVAPHGWVDCETGLHWAPRELPFSRVATFCGLANPASFWRTVRGLGYKPVSQWTFSDHHHYRPLELRRLAAQARSAGAEVLLTTEKDLMNLCEQVPAWIAPLRLCWLRIGLEVDDAPRLLRFIEERLYARFRRRT